MSIWSKLEKRISNIADELLPDEYRGELAAARALYDDGKYEECGAAAQVLVAKRPDHVPSLILLGKAALARKDYTPAQNAFSRALLVDEHDVQVLLGFADASIALGELEDAAAKLRTAIDEAGGNSQILAAVYQRLGRAYHLADEPNKAIRELRKAMAEDPSDPVNLGYLAWLLQKQRQSTAAVDSLLEQVAPDRDTPAILLLALGVHATQANRLEQARNAYSTLLARDHTPDTPEDERIYYEALTHLGDILLALGLLDAAEQQFRRAVAARPDDEAMLDKLASTLIANGTPNVVWEFFASRIENSTNIDLLVMAIEAARNAGATDALPVLAKRLLAIKPNHPEGLFAQCLALVKDNNDAEAIVQLRNLIARVDHHDAKIELASALLREGFLEVATRKPTEACTVLLSVLQHAPDNERAKALLEEARRAQYGLHDNTTYPLELIRCMRKLAEDTAVLSEFVPVVNTIIADYDQPLILAVMGEFSTGKSSIINAFIGAEIAPTGATPTTATINIVKFGRNRGGRIVYRDGRVEDVAWESLQTSIQRISESIDGKTAAANIHHVEILLPLPILQQVNIIDTPGFNSIRAEHQDVATSMLDQADAIVWVFSSAQAGKLTEKRLLDEAQKRDIRMLGVLNKVDQLRDDETEQLLQHITTELGSLVVEVLPLSAKRALTWKLQTAEDDGGWTTLQNRLEDQFFANARKLKQTRCKTRATRINRELEHKLRPQVEELSAALDAMAHNERELERAGRDFLERDFVEIRGAISTQSARLLRTAASEILELVRPRRLPFGSHKATRADRDYLLGVLQQGYEQALSTSRAQLADKLETALDAIQTKYVELASALGDEGLHDIQRTIDREIATLGEHVQAGPSSYVRGYLHGGYIDNFFRVDLPKLALEEDAVYHALYRDAVDLDRELTHQLRTRIQRGFDTIIARCRYRSRRTHAALVELEAGLLSTLGEIRDRLTGKIKPTPKTRESSVQTNKNRSTR